MVAVMNRALQASVTLIFVALVLTGAALVMRDLMVAGIAILVAVAANVLMYLPEESDDE